MTFELTKILKIFLVIILLSEIVFANVYGLAQDAGGTKLSLSTGDKVTVVGNDGYTYTIQVLDLNLPENRALISVSSQKGSNMYSLSKNQEITVGSITITLNYIYVGVSGKLYATFVLYGVTLIGNYLTLIIKSDPKTCEVYINNQMIGYSPVTYFLPPGDYTITVNCNGKTEEKSLIVFRDDVNQTKTLYFEFLSYGTISINSTPPGAEVYLNNTFLGVTPISTYKTLSGNYTVKILKQGFLPYITQVTVMRNQSVVINAKLTPETGTLKIYSNPPSAEVYVDGNFTGVTPLAIPLPQGIHEVKITKNGYLSYSRRLNIVGGDISVLNVTLIPKNSTLTVISNILNASVYLDNKKIGTTPLKGYILTPGIHEIKVLKEGYSPFLQRITIKPGDDLKITVNLSPSYAVLNVYSNVQGADIYLDGKLIGKTPLEGYKLLGDKHTLEIIAEGYKVFAQNITTKLGKTLTVNAKLLPMLTQSSTVVTPASDHSIWQFPLSYAGISVFGLFVLALVVIKKHRGKSLFLNFPPQLLKKYEPLEFLGEGGFARVYKVKRKRDKKIIALKVFPADEKAKKFFTKEVRAWKLLTHPNIVKLYNASDEPVPHLEIEFIEGHTMDGKLIRDLEHYPKPVDEKLALKFIEGIAKGLRHAHSMQVYHRDLKPSNILLKDDLTPKITDFGLAKVGSKSTTTTTKALTPLYAAPEQIDEKTYGHTDHRTDIYQLGVILYELLTGKLPYEGSSHIIILAKITNPEITPQPPSKYNLSLAKYDRMFEKLLAKRKEGRYQSVDEFLEEFKKLVRLLKEKEKLKETLKVTKKTITATKNELELKKLNLELLKVLVQNTILSAKINDKEEVINTLYDLMPFTKNHRAELNEAIRQVQVFIETGTALPEEFIDTLRILLHKIEKENSLNYKRPF